MSVCPQVRLSRYQVWQEKPSGAVRTVIIQVYLVRSRYFAFASSLARLAPVSLLTVEELAGIPFIREECEY